MCLVNSSPDIGIADEFFFYINMYDFHTILGYIYTLQKLSEIMNVCIILMHLEIYNNNMQAHVHRLVSRQILIEFENYQIKKKFQGLEQV